MSASNLGQFQFWYTTHVVNVGSAFYIAIYVGIRNTDVIMDHWTYHKRLNPDFT